jgi:hypothetical protein
MAVLKGQASVKIGRDTYGNVEPPGPGQEMSACFFTWDSFRGQAKRNNLNPKAIVQWDRTYPAPQALTTKLTPDMAAEVEGLRTRAAGKPLDRVLEEMILGSGASDRAFTPVLAVYCLAALDELDKVIDVLADEDERHLLLRDRAIQTLRHWIGRRTENDNLLYQKLTNAKRYQASEAETIMQLLHDLTPQQLADKESWTGLIAYLDHNRPAIRQLMFWHLSHLVPEVGMDPSKYSPDGDSAKRQKARDAWQVLLKTGKIPPPQQPHRN